MPHRSPVVRLACIFLFALAVSAGASPKPVRSQQFCGKDAALAGVETPKDNRQRTAYLGDWVKISICHTDEFLLAASKDQKDVTLFINGVDSGVKADKVNLDEGSMTFPLDRNDKNKALWAPLLYNPIFEREEELYLSVGEHGDVPLRRLPQANMRITFDKIYLTGWYWIWAILLVAVVVASVAYARKSDMLRDAPKINGKLQTYSLARVQMAWWFVLVVVAYVLIWIVTGDRDSIPASLLGLMGISAATALAAVAITPRAEERATLARDGLDRRRNAVAEKINMLDAALAGTTDPAVQEELTKRKGELQHELADIALAATNITPESPSKNIWYDLVTDDRGAVALDRFQIVVWTVVLGLIFASSVIWDLTMPEFGATMLALMGISSGTYVGFKLPQKSAAASPTTAGGGSS
ncbi:MAG: hypothetical protein JWO56_2140 [Acidobacteria bacterium]|nr:hypothetical protein [Acidobacteriota bacterium]